MIRKDVRTFKDGSVKTEVRVTEGYRNNNGDIRQRTIKSFGYLEDHPNTDEFLKEIELFNKNFLLEKKKKKDSFTRPFNESKTNTPYNYGYKFLESIYNSLKLDEFFKTKITKAEYNLSEVFKFLVIERILNPDSKRATFQVKDSLYNYECSFELHDIYRALDKFNEVNVELQKHLNDRIKQIIGRDTLFAYYDVTNYYTTIDFPKDKNDIRQNGVSKEHSLDPIIQLGLFIDDKGLPISMSLFKGNTSDTKTLQPIMKEIKKNYELKKLIVVADKGINSSTNIDYIINNNDGFVFSQILKGKKGKRYHKDLFDENGYVYNEAKTFKSKTLIEEYTGIDSFGNEVSRKRKVLLYWDKANEDLAERKREGKVERAEKSLKNNAYAIKHSYEEYIKEIKVVNNTGEVADKVVREIDEDKIENDALFDGYFCIVTSELEYDTKKILEVYSGLWRIEESFKITKSDLEFRPIFLGNESRINGHFVICFTSLLIIRLLQYKLNYSLSVERIVRALNTSKCIKEENDTILVMKNECFKKYEDYKTKITDKDETLEDYLFILKSFDVKIPYERYLKTNFSKFLETIQY